MGFLGKAYRSRRFPCFLASMLFGAACGSGGPLWFGTDVSRGGGTVAAQESSPEGMTWVLAAQETVQRAIATAAPSVVAIARTPKGGGIDSAAAMNFNLPGLPPLALPFGDLEPQSIAPLEFGSGVILSSDGLILTCYHLLDDPREHDYYVWLSPSAVGGGQAGSRPAVPTANPAGGGAATMVRASAVVRAPAVVRAGDPWTDFAVLQLQMPGELQLPVMPMGDAASVRRGSFVIALGNPYATAIDGQASASWGIVANLQRRALRPRDDGSGGPRMPESLQEFGSLIATDAKLHLGTSGGALVNLEGKMIGLTTSLAAVAGFEQAAGYAIPIDAPAQAAIDQLRQGRQPAFGFLGVEPIDAGGGRGALVRSVVPGMSAAVAGIREGDLIVAVDGQPIDSAQTLFYQMGRREAESTAALTVVSRGGQPRDVPVVLGKKRLALLRPGYSTVEEPSWRGMVVDMASVLPPNRLFSNPGQTASSAAIVRVDPDSPAWRAGLRPGQVILRVGTRLVERPADFYAAVGAPIPSETIAQAAAANTSPPPSPNREGGEKEAAQTVTVWIADPLGNPQKREVPPE